MRLFKQRFTQWFNKHFPSGGSAVCAWGAGGELEELEEDDKGTED
jgi:hypothetical protein